MLDNEFNLNLGYDQDFLSIEMEDQGTMELTNQEEKQPSASMWLLVYGKDLFYDSQLVEVVSKPPQDPVLCPPATDAGFEKALQPGDFSWIEDVEA